MKFLSALISLFLTVPVCAQSHSDSPIVNFTAIESIGGELLMKLSVEGSAQKKGLLFKKIIAKKKAISSIKKSITKQVSAICESDSLVTSDLSLPLDICRNQGDHVLCKSSDLLIRCMERSERITLDFKLDKKLIHPSSACIEAIRGKFKLSDNIINSCNKISTKKQFQCVSAITDYSSIRILSIKACSAFGSDQAQKALSFYKDRRFEAPGPALIVLLAAIDTEKELACIKNKMNLSSLSISDLEKSCIEDTKLQLDRREYEALGFVFKPRTIQYRLRRPQE